MSSLRGLASSWFQHELLDHTNYPPSLHKLIQDQNSIGWNQLFRGRMVKEWARLQQQSLSDNGCQKPTLSGRSWVATVVTTLWTRFFELWAERNNLVHGVAINDVTAVQKSKLLAELQDLHSRRDSFHHSDLPYLIAPSDADSQKLVDFVDTNYVSTIRTWLRMWKPTLLEDGARLRQFKPFKARVKSSTTSQLFTACSEIRIRSIGVASVVGRYGSTDGVLTCLASTELHHSSAILLLLLTFGGLLSQQTIF
jgi:hypothetical protein